MRYTGGTQAAPIGSPMSGTFTAIDAQDQQDRLAAQDAVPHRRWRRLDRHGRRPASCAASRTATSWRSTPRPARCCWQFQTGFGADAPPVVYEVDGEQYIAIATGGNQMQGSAYGDAVWTFSLKGQLEPAVAAAAAADRGRTRPDRLPTGVDTVKIGDNNVEYGYCAGAHADQGGDAR